MNTSPDKITPDVAPQIAWEVRLDDSRSLVGYGPVPQRVNELLEAGKIRIIRYVAQSGDSEADFRDYVSKGIQPNNIPFTESALRELEDNILRQEILNQVNSELDRKFAELEGSMVSKTVIRERINNAASRIEDAANLPQDKFAQEVGEALRSIVRDL